MIEPSIFSNLRTVFAIEHRSGSVCLNNKPRFISGLWAVCQRCRVVHGGERRLTCLDYKIIAMYARSMKVREIQGFLPEMHAVDTSPDLICESSY